MLQLDTMLDLSFLSIFSADFFGIDLVDLINFIGVVGVAAIVFAESGLLIGFFLPGDSLLFTSGILVHQNILQIDIHFFALILFLAAALGDNVGYTFGKQVGPRLFNRPNSRLFKKDHLDKASTFYAKYGAKTIVLARFIPAIRTFAPIVAGAGKMPYKTFLLFNMLGALIWAVGMTYLGYYAGAWAESRGINIHAYLIPIVLLIIVVSVLPPVIQLLKNPSSRKRISRAFKAKS